MRILRTARLLLPAALVCVLAPAVTFAVFKDRAFTPPRAFHAKVYPAHEAHENEKFSVAADPYDTANKTENLFYVNYKKEGFLPVHIIFSNDGDQPISLAGMKVLLITKKQAKIEPAVPDDLYRRIARQKRRGDEASRNPFPVPLPRKAIPAAVKREAVREIQSAIFRANAVEAHGTQAGFFFFDVEGIENPLPGATLVFTGIRDANGQELFFFEIPLEKYLSYQPAP